MLHNFDNDWCGKHIRMGLISVYAISFLCDASFDHDFVYPHYLCFLYVGLSTLKQHVAWIMFRDILYYIYSKQGTCLQFSIKVSVRKLHVKNYFEFIIPFTSNLHITLYLRLKYCIKCKQWHNLSMKRRKPKEFVHVLGTRTFIVRTIIVQVRSLYTYFQCRESWFHNI